MLRIFHNRRDFLTVGSLSALGLSLGDYLGLRQAVGSEQRSSGEPRAKSVIHIFLPGGVAQQESFDPKPFSPPEYRSEFNAIETAVTGEKFCETLPHTAKIADRLCVIRTMTHGEAAHERGVHNMFTGYKPSPALVFPSMGSVVSHELGPRNNLPPYVCVPSQPNEFAGAGFLSSAFAPFSLGADPSAHNFKVRDLAPPAGINEDRFQRRRALLDVVNDYFHRTEESDILSATETFYQRAYSLISSPQAREAFNIDSEPDSVRDEYGRHEAGQRMLMARRLVSAGVRFVSLTVGGWDMHAQLVKGIKEQMPPLDQAFAALVRDLERTGLLDETLVMLSTEFGRTPKINKDGGRDHWPKVFSTVLAGGGVKRGYFHGASNAIAAEAEGDVVGPEDLAATIYYQLGIVADKRLIAPGNRPVKIVDGGRVRQELLA
jgi:hypothetical protein